MKPGILTIHLESSHKFTTISIPAGSLLESRLEYRKYQPDTGWRKCGYTYVGPL